MKNKLPKICYWCGIELRNEENKKEHVPPYSFFPKGYRNNLVTVPSCAEHNNQFSELDEKFQFLIKAMFPNQIAMQDFNDRVIRGLKRKEKSKFVENIKSKSFTANINNKPQFLIQLEGNEGEVFLEKIIRGIYFYHKEKPAKGIIQSISKTILNENIDRPAIVDYLKEDLNPETLTKGDFNNAEIFSYYFLDFEDVFMIQMKFYENAEFIGWAFPEGFSFDKDKHYS